MEWSSDFSIGVDDIDAQHRQLVGLAAKFKDAISDRRSDELPGEMGRILIFLVNYTNYHFEAEEALMEEVAFPELDRHRILHRNLVEQIRDILTRLKTSKSYKPIEFYYFLTRWLTEHILEEDAKIALSVRKARYRSNPTERIPVEEPGRVAAMFEPNFHKLDLMERNRLIDAGQKKRKKDEMLRKFLSGLKVDLPEHLVFVLESLSVLQRKGYLDDQECKIYSTFLFQSVDLDRVLVNEGSPENKGDFLRKLAERALIGEDLLSQYTS